MLVAYLELTGESQVGDIENTYIVDRWSTWMERCSLVLEYSLCHGSRPRWNVCVVRASCP